MSGEQGLNRRLNRLNRHDLLRLVGSRLLAQGQRLVDGGLVTALRVEDNILRGRVREKQGRQSTLVRLRLPAGHPALESTLEILEPAFSDGLTVLTHFEAALLLAWVQQHNPAFQGIAISSTSGVSEVDMTAQHPPSTQPDWLHAFAEVPPDALWRGMRGPYGTLPALLLQQRVADMRRIAKRLGIRSTKESKETLLPQMVPLLCRPETVQSAVAGLSPLQRTMLALFILRDSGMPPYTANEVAQRLQLIDNPEGMPGITISVSEALKSLQTAGLVFADDPSHDYAADHQVPLEIAGLYLPDLADLPHGLAWVEPEPTPAPAPPDLLATLRGLVMALRARTWPVPPLPNAHDLQERLAALRGWHNDAEELEQLQQAKSDLWRWQYDQSIRLTVCPPPALLSTNDLTTLAHETGSTPGMVHLLLRLLEALRVLRADPPHLTLAASIDSLLLRPVEEQRRLLTTTWAWMINWSEIHDLEDLRLERGMYHTSGMRSDQLYAELAAARRFLLRLLRLLDPDRWYRVADVIALVQSIHPRFLLEQQSVPLGPDNRDAWWLRPDNGRKLDPTKKRDWKQGEARLLQHLLTGPLAWLGMLELGGTSSDYLRLTPTGAYLLGLRDAYLREESGRILQIQAEPDAARVTVRLALADAVPQVLHTLEQIAQAAGLDQGTLVYTITPQQLRDGLMHGQTVEQVQAFMREHAREPQPDAALALLKKWGSGFGQATIYTRLALIELADDLLLPELLRSTRLEHAILEQLTPRLLLVDPAAADALFDELVAKGYTPRRMRVP
ncbi:MAG: helicase-associated domain-containing protein [Chloroflexaceae bacterium]